MIYNHSFLKDRPMGWNNLKGPAENTPIGAKAPVTFSVNPILGVLFYSKFSDPIKARKGEYTESYSK